MFTKGHSAKTKEKIRQALLGRSQSKETRLKISETLANKLMKNKGRYRSLGGHVVAIYNSIHKYAKKWKIPVVGSKEFKDWAYDNKDYDALFNAWVESNYDENLSPVVMRKIKKDGYILSNLNWDVKKNYSWWNEEIKVYQEVEFEVNEYQKAKNKSNKEFRKKLREEWKAKLKAKREGNK